jgi:hypothetical protein
MAVPTECKGEASTAADSVKSGSPRHRSAVLFFTISWAARSVGPFIRSVAVA